VSFNIYSNGRSSSVLNLYNNSKSGFGYEQYLDLIPRNVKTCISRKSMPSHTLLIQPGRYDINRIPRNERYCIIIL
jgi:hypothetical protein